MNKKFYEEPEVDIELFQFEDLLAGASRDDPDPTDEEDDPF